MKTVNQSAIWNADKFFTGIYFFDISSQDISETQNLFLINQKQDI
jgi:hypothetical protein